MRGRFGIFGILFIAVLALLVGGVAYNWGLAAGQTAVAAPGAVVYPIGYGHPFGFGFGIVGFLFFLLFIGLLIAAFRPRRWSGGPGGWGRGMGPGGWGHGAWGPGWGGRFDPDDPRAKDWMPQDVPPAMQPMLEAWHRKAHGDTGTDATASSSGRGSGTPPANG